MKRISVASIGIVTACAALLLGLLDAKLPGFLTDLVLLSPTLFIGGFLAIVWIRADDRAALPRRVLLVQNISLVIGMLGAGVLLFVVQSQVEHLNSEYQVAKNTKVHPPTDRRHDQSQTRFICRLR